MADSAQNTFAFTRALEEANRAYQLVSTYRNQQAQIGSMKRDASFLEDDDVFPITMNMTASGVTQLRPLAPYPSRGLVFRDAVHHIDDFTLPLPTVDLTQYPFTFAIPDTPTMRMLVPPSRATPPMRVRSPPATPFSKRPRFKTPPPSDNPPSPSPAFAVHAHAILYSSSTPASSRISDSGSAGPREETDVSNRRVTRSGHSFAAHRGGTTRPSVPRTVSTPLSQSIVASSGSSVQIQHTNPLPVALPPLPSGLPTPTPGLLDTRRAKHACFLQCGNSFQNVFKPGARKRGDRYGTHMFGGSDKQREKNPPCSVAVKMRCTKDETTDEIVDVAVIGTFLLLKEPALAPRFEYPQICGRLRAALVTWYAALLVEAAQAGSASEQQGAEEEKYGPEDGDGWLTDRDAEFDEELDDEDLMYE
ncbi:hypothetical protein EXIGLDRAFT_772946 [Exidia glandulosa HHB12029]|uniref:Uncharacterized protein n=1 Tax=Exidia glandulosa HHB12029 TaxID=1314781 RepID=A0A165F184_EXIGL|nr:hypothetical protein EXIGLDRAFT_772946 [Exidia glandulosa HHB12029]